MHCYWFYCWLFGVVSASVTSTCFDCYVFISLISSRYSSFVFFLLCFCFICFFFLCISFCYYCHCNLLFECNLLLLLMASCMYTVQHSYITFHTEHQPKPLTDIYIYIVYILYWWFCFCVGWDLLYMFIVVYSLFVFLREVTLFSRSPCAQHTNFCINTRKIRTMNLVYNTYKFHTELSIDHTLSVRKRLLFHSAARSFINPKIHSDKSRLKISNIWWDSCTFRFSLISDFWIFSFVPFFCFCFSTFFALDYDVKLYNFSFPKYSFVTLHCVTL